MSMNSRGGKGQPCLALFCMSFVSDGESLIFMLAIEPLYNAAIQFNILVLRSMCLHVAIIKTHATWLKSLLCISSQEKTLDSSPVGMVNQI